MNKWGGGFTILVKAWDCSANCYYHGKHKEQFRPHSTVGTIERSHGKLVAPWERLTMGELDHGCSTMVDFTMHGKALGHGLPHVVNIAFYLK